jgi:cyclopropane fatty-acyl-phospholipid synthase-like methyltransferase
VLDSLPSNHYNLIVSFDVLEHVPQKDVPHLLDNLERINKPGGFQIHQIVISDHLVQYDPGVSRKNYLRYSNRVWKRFFDNKVQHINRIQASDWRCLFAERKETILFEQVSKVPLEGLKISKDFLYLSKDDWETAVFLMLLRHET